MTLNLYQPLFTIAHIFYKYIKSYLLLLLHKFLHLLSMIFGIRGQVILVIQISKTLSSHARSFDMKKKNFLLQKIFIKIKQKCWLSYKIQHSSEDIYEKLHIDFISTTMPTRWNKYKYSLTITDSYSSCQQIENIYKKYKARFCVKQFIIFIKKQSEKNVKYLQLDQGQKFDIRNLESWTKEKKIKVKLSMAYNPKIYGITEYTNSIVTSIAKCLLLNTPSNIGHSFSPKAFTIAIYLLNCFFVPLQI